MHKSVQILIAAACVVAIAAGSLWLHDRNQMRQAAKAEAEGRERAVAEQMASECRAIIRNWYSPGSLQLAGTEGNLPGCTKSIAGTVEEAEDCAALITAWSKSKSAPTFATRDRISYCETLVNSSKPSE